MLSYNIHHAQGGDGVVDLERIAAVIRAANPDLVSLQEVDRAATRSGNVDQPAELARLTGMQFAFGSNIPLQGGQYGNAILSRFTIRRYENHALPNTGGGEQRGLLAAVLKWPGAGDSLVFFATHLDHRANDQQRYESAQVINRLALSRDSHPALLAGDLNDVHGSRTLRELETHWVHTNGEPLPTIPVGRPRRQIDFILLRPAGRWRVIEVRVLEEALASDHRPVLAIVQLTDRDR